MTKAEEIYNERISPYIEEYAPYYRVKIDSSKGDISEVTGLCSYLAALLDKPESEGMYEYCALGRLRTDLYT